MTDRIRIGDVLRSGNVEITIKDIYLFKGLGRNHATMVTFDHKNLETGQVILNEQSASMNFEGWEKV